MHESFLFYICLLLIIMLLVMLAQKIKISYPIVLVVGGFAISFIPSVPSIHISPQLIFLIFLPPLLYDAAWQTSWKDFWKWRRVIASFAFPIVIITSAVIAVISNQLIPGFTLALGFLLGGIISPPDAVSATSILKEVKVPKRTSAILEGESLLNDASSLIVYRFALAAVITGSFSIGEASYKFVEVVVMGIATGLIIGVIFYALHRWMPTTASIDTVLTFVEPYIMYIVAEHFHYSGVLAVVTGGLYLSNRSHVILNHVSRLQTVNVWQTIGFLFNGFVFLLIGLEFTAVIKATGTNLNSNLIYGIVISIAVIILRLLSTMGASVFTMFASKFIKTEDSRPGWRGPMVIGWAGMRGVVSLASALSIPLVLKSGQPFPHRETIVFITFIVIMFTLVFQGLTLPWIIKKFGEPERDYLIPEQEQEAMVKSEMKNVALALLDKEYKEDAISNILLKELKTRLSNELAYVDGRHSRDEHEAVQNKLRFQAAYKHVIEVQRQKLQELNQKPEFEEDVIDKYVSQLDLEEEKLRQQFEL
ncbi:Na+/H+ antiporter [Mucilaginibacter aquatilis]|uniref:Na+/H+ antiporter n=1 Tax=Mucilaginibacter aquatilis TaxID=1517760 RepID=A0A6I4IHY4_9SPHI|nr:Na+/H+ antiporter [Mucilaginibacter aquatilis]MVN93126.1 Na+/H+ antiporter [Mucilaginibacter aquatilis]